MKNVNKINATREKINEYSRNLRLPGIRRYLNSSLETSELNSLNNEEFLLDLLEKEYELRLSNAKKRLIRLSGFPENKSLDSLDYSYFGKTVRQGVKTLKSLDFIRNGQNVIMSGNPGTGKTHTAIGLGLLACFSGFKVLFKSVPSLIIEIKESSSSRKLGYLEQRFLKYDLIICDELGYISFDKEGGELLFHLLSLRANRKSTIITTNLTFDRWDELFHDKVLTTALVDRLTHKAYLLNMLGRSYRLEETKEWLKGLKKKE